MADDVRCHTGADHGWSFGKRRLGRVHGLIGSALKLGAAAERRQRRGMSSGRPAFVSRQRWAGGSGAMLWGITGDDGAGPARLIQAR